MDPSNSALPQIPVTIVGGFPEAGKTALLKQSVTAQQGRRLGVLVNDHGGINAEAELGIPDHDVPAQGRDSTRTLV